MASTTNTAISTIMNIVDHSVFVKAFTAFNITWVAAVGGAAIGMYLFSVPVIEKGRNHSTHVMLRQFHALIRRGIQYLQAGSRVQGVTMVLLTALAYRHPSPAIREAWPYFAAAAFVGAQVAWYEVVFVFPINDTLIEMEKRMEHVDEKADEAMRPEVIKLLERWRRWHIGRIVIPFVVVAIMVTGLPI